jgi:hypothetical protein
MGMALGARASWGMDCERGLGRVTLRWWSRVAYAAPEGVRRRRRGWRGTAAS